MDNSVEASRYRKQEVSSPSVPVNGKHFMRGLSYNLASCNTSLLVLLWTEGGVGGGLY